MALTNTHPFDNSTLAARQRQILHIIADSWAPNGGHFEQYIRFGYDTDLGRVWAKFEAGVLTVSVSRRMLGVAY